MNVTLVRSPSSPEGTFGAWETDDGFKCVDLERPADGEFPCIPVGTYHVEWIVGVHPAHPAVYEVMNVPGRSAILIHSANWIEQLLGCIALGASKEIVSGTWDGMAINHMGITASKATLAEFITHMKQEPFTLTISEA